MTASKRARVRATESGAVGRAPRGRAQPVPSVGALTAIAWVPRGDLDLREWLEHGTRFGAIGRGVAWWLGDWLIFGNARYGERYTRAARATGYDPQSLMKLVDGAS